MKETCMGDAYDDCDKEAVYIRHTQFAGSHPLCEEHAKKDVDFMKNDSYTVWSEIE